MREKRAVVVLATKEPARAAEALRAAVGLTLRGGRVAVVRAVPVDLGGDLARRALGTLEALGHDTDAPLAAIRDADAVEVWT